MDIVAPKTQKTHFVGLVLFLKYIVLAPTYFRHKRLSSALAGLIALFGMGRDVTPPSKYQNIIFEFLIFFALTKSVVIFKVLNRNRNISTSQLKRLLALHLKPINVIISYGS